MMHGPDLHHRLELRPLQLKRLWALPWNVRPGGSPLSAGSPECLGPWFLGPLLLQKHSPLGLSTKRKPRRPDNYTSWAASSRSEGRVVQLLTAPGLLHVLSGCRVHEPVVVRAIASALLGRAPALTSTSTRCRTATLSREGSLAGRWPISVAVSPGGGLGHIPSLSQTQAGFCFTLHKVAG